MDREKQRQRYIAGTEGAPPVPPPGGYRGAKRQQSAYVSPAPAPATAGYSAGETAAAAIEKKPSSVFSRIVLAVAGNALKAFPGLGTLGGGVLHAFAYALIFDSMVFLTDSGRLILRISSCSRISPRLLKSRAMDS